MPQPDLCSEVPHETPHIVHDLRVWNEHAMRCIHVVENLLEADVIVAVDLAAEQTLESRYALFHVIVRYVLVGTVTAADVRFAVIALFVYLYVECIGGDRR